MSPGQVAKVAAPASAGDLLGTLPDALLQHILSFLPTQQAVRTCVLARRWQHLWEDMTGLRITAANSPDVPCAPDDLALVREIREFVDHLLLLRGRASIDTCEFMFNVPADCDDDVPHVNLWIRHVIRCNVRLLQLSISREDHDSGLYFFVDNLPIVSRHMTKLELTHTGLNDSFLDFSGCPVLEDLVIYNGNFLHVKKIQSKSLKHLSLLDCTNNNQLRTYVDVPSLISLRLEDPSDRTPVLGSMPSLITAFVRYSPQTWPDDRCYNSELGDCGDDSCEACNGDTERNKSVLLKGLSEAESLVLVDCCQTGPEYKVKIKGIYNAIEGSAAISENLKAVEIKCDMVDDRVIEVLNFLITLNIRYGYEEKKGFGRTWLCYLLVASSNSKQSVEHRQEIMIQETEVRQATAMNLSRCLGQCNRIKHRVTKHVSEMCDRFGGQPKLHREAAVIGHLAGVTEEVKEFVRENEQKKGWKGAPVARYNF